MVLDTRTLGVGSRTALVDGLLTADKFRRVLTVESTTKRLSMVQRLGRSRSAALAA
jgi:hypothetical protein